MPTVAVPASHRARRVKVGASCCANLDAPARDAVLAVQAHLHGTGLRSTLHGAMQTDDFLSQEDLHGMNVDRIARALMTCYNAEDGLSIDVSKRLYARLIASSPAYSGFKEEAESALSDPGVSWKELLSCTEYGVQMIETEDEARILARTLLLDPLGT